MPSRPIRVVFVGTDQFPTLSLEMLLKTPDFAVVAVVTQPDKKQGRHQEVLTSPVKQVALKHNLLILQPEKIIDSLSTLQKLEPDFLVVCYYGQIIPKAILDLPKYGCINIHPSLLPRYRGASPMQSAILNGETETGLTFIKLIEKLDAGPIFLVRREKILSNDTAETLEIRLSQLAALILPDLLRDILDKNLTPLPQPQSGVTYCRPFRREDGQINWKEKTAAQIFNQIRAFVPWPGSFTFWQKKRLKIEAAEYQKIGELSPGMVGLVENKIAIGCKSGVLFPQVAQLEGKKRVTIEEFVKGYNSFVGSILD